MPFNELHLFACPFVLSKVECNRERCGFQFIEPPIFHGEKILLNHGDVLQTGINKRVNSNFVAAWNRSGLRAVRKSTNHEMVNYKRTYCASCQWHHQIIWKRKKFTKRGGKNVITWCFECGQAICDSCWDLWHSGRSLKKHAPTERERRQYEQEVKSKH